MVLYPYSCMLLIVLFCWELSYYYYLYRERDTNGCRYDAIYYDIMLHTALQWFEHNSNRRLDSRNALHTSPPWMSYGGPIMKILEKNNRAITASHCIVRWRYNFHENPHNIYIYIMDWIVFIKNTFKLVPYMHSWLRLGQWGKNTSVVALVAAMLNNAPRRANRTDFPREWYSNSAGLLLTSRPRYRRKIISILHISYSCIPFVTSFMILNEQQYSIETFIMVTK